MTSGAHASGSASNPTGSLRLLQRETGTRGQSGQSGMFLLVLAAREAPFETSGCPGFLMSDPRIGIAQEGRKRGSSP